MIISIDQVVSVFVYLLVVGLVFGLLFWLISYIEAKFPGAVMFSGIARIILMVLAVLVLISILLSFIGHPIITFR